MLNVFDAAKSVSIIDVYNVYGKSTCRFSRGNVSCPMPNHGGEDNHPSMHLYPETNSFYCFKCGAHGSPIDFVMQIKGYNDPKVAAEDICAMFNIQYQTETIIDHQYLEYTSRLEAIANDFKICLEHRCPDPEYFQKRGISKEIVERYQLGYCPQDYEFEGDKDFLRSVGLIDYYGNSNYKGRYIFPIFDIMNHIIGFAGRSLNSDEPKYINTPTNLYFEKRKNLYNIQEAKKYPSVYIVEGYMDALSLISSGIPNVVALMGTVLTENHLQILSNKKLILSLDSDDAGFQKTMAIITTYKNILFSVVDPIPTKDFNECLMDTGVEGVQYFTKQIITGLDFLIRSFSVYGDLSTLTGREKLWEEIAKVIGVPDPNYQAKYPININYSPVTIDYYWAVINKIIKGGRMYAKNDSSQSDQA